MKNRKYPAAFVLVVAAAAMAEERPAPPVGVGRQYPPLILPRLDDGSMVAIDSFAGKKLVVVQFAPSAEAGRRALATWNKKASQWADRDDVAVIGVAQEQHADRARLLCQWRRVTIPVLHDALNQSGETAAARVYCLDGQAFVRAIDPDAKSLAAFLKKSYRKKSKGIRELMTRAPELKVVQRQAGESRNAAEWRTYGDALFHHGETAVLHEAIRTYQTGIQFEPLDAWSHFRLGVALRTRFDGGERQEGDLEAAVAAWKEAARLMPGNEIFALRAAQFDATAARAESLYGWVAEARKAVAKRGDTPVTLKAEPTDVETSGGKKKQPAKG